jgi:U3 small nucleolar RNA-associated protein 14
MRKMRNAYKNLVGKAEGQLTLGVSKCINIKAKEYVNADWTQVAQDIVKWRPIVNKRRIIP